METDVELEMPSPQESESQGWWQWPWIVLATIGCAFLGSFAAKLFATVGSIAGLQGDWYVLYLALVIEGLAFGVCWGYVAYRLAPRRKLAVGVCMIVLLVVLTVSGIYLQWTELDWASDRLTRSTVLGFAQVVGGLVGVPVAHKTRSAA